jgi:hypothetical protein
LGPLAVKKSTIAVCLCLSVISSDAKALDWSLSSTLTETVEANDNPFLRAVAGGTLSSYSTIIANATARMPDAKFTFDGSINYQKYWGPGVDGVPSENFGGSAHLFYEAKGKVDGDREYVEAGWHRSTAAFALLGQLGVLTNARGFVDASSVGGGIDRSLSALDTVSLAAHSTYNSYDPGTAGIAFTDTLANATWKHRISPIATLVASSDAEFEHFDNALNTDITILRESGGFDATLSPLLSLRGMAGVAYVQTERGSPSSTIVPVATLPATAPGASVSGSLTDFIGNIVLTYKLRPDTTLTLNANQTIAPSTVGSLIKTSTAGTGLSYRVNSHETLSFEADVSRTLSAGVTSDFLSGSIVYSYILTKDWTAQLSYRHLHQFAVSGTTATGFVVDPITGIPIPVVSGTGPIDSNSIMATVSRTITVLPDGY